MNDFLEEARALEMVREDRKWYENVEAVADLAARAYLDGIMEGRKQAQERCCDQYAPPVGPLGLATEESAKASAQVHFRGQVFYARDDVPRDTLYFLQGGSIVGKIVGLAPVGPGEIPRDFYAPVPQPDGDGRFPGEAE